MSKLEIKYVSPDDLRPYAGNARTHSKKQIRQIADSIQRFGFTNPVIVSVDREVIAGHGRLEHVPIICTRNPHGGSNWRLGGRSVVERMSRWRGRGDEWFVRQAFAEMPSVC
jgi:hypothetical protein